MAYARTPLRVRFWRRMAPHVGAPHECWEWPGTRSWGYGYIGEGGKGGRQLRTHRLAYELCVGPIPEGHDLHHTCENRACCNPAHLDPVRRRSHLLGHATTIPGRNAAKTHCVHGHEFTPANTYITSRGARFCRPCDAARHREARRNG